MPDESNRPIDKQSHAGGFTLDLSSGKPSVPSAPKRKGATPVVQQTVNLSTPKPEVPPEPAADKQETPRRNKAVGNGRGRSRSGSTLADLLDPETLAKLRGEDRDEA